MTIYEQLTQYLKNHASHHGGLAIRFQNEHTAGEMDALSVSLHEIWWRNKNIGGIQVHRAIDYRILPGDPRTDDFRAVYDPL